MELESGRASPVASAMMAETRRQRLRAVGLLRSIQCMCIYIYIYKRRSCSCPYADSYLCHCISTCARVADRKAVPEAIPGRFSSRPCADLIADAPLPVLGIVRRDAPFLVPNSANEPACAAFVCSLISVVPAQTPGNGDMRYLGRREQIFRELRSLLERDIASCRPDQHATLSSMCICGGVLSHAAV